ncbi:MAG: hypothetical protein GJ676_18630 [Rhodobacteraceae bacterium]|nr:hypothetical protein [Paracoccaceae bacterium]
MKTAVLTMVYRDHWFLKQWLAYYGPRVGRKHLYVVSHGDEPEIRQIAAGCNIIPFERNTLENFDQRRWAFLNRVQADLHQIYDCVITGDVDELILHEDVDASLIEVLEQFRDHHVAFAAGFDLVEDPRIDHEFDDRQALLSQRKLGFWSAGYSKPLVSYKPVTYIPGAHRIRGANYFLAPGLLMAHLKYADSRQSNERIQIRDFILEEGGHTMKWNNPWRKQKFDGDPRKTQAFLEEPKAFEESYDYFTAQISEPKVGRGRGIGAPKVREIIPFHLPDRFERV